MFLNLSNSLKMVAQTSYNSPGFMSVDSKREEELQARQVPQLEARPQRLSDNVHRVENRKVGSIHE